MSRSITLWDISVLVCPCRCRAYQAWYDAEPATLGPTATRAAEMAASRLYPQHSSSEWTAEVVKESERRAKMRLDRAAHLIRIHIPKAVREELCSGKYQVVARDPAGKKVTLSSEELVGLEVDLAGKRLVGPNRVFDVIDVVSTKILDDADSGTDSPHGSSTSVLPALDMAGKVAETPGYVSPWISITSAIDHVSELVGFNAAWPQIRDAIRDGALSARGMYEGGVYGDLRPEWLSAVIWEKVVMDTLFFRDDRRGRFSPPAPGRIGEIEVDGRQVAKLWPAPLKAETTSPGEPRTETNPAAPAPPSPSRALFQADLDEKPASLTAPGKPNGKASPFKKDIDAEYVARMGTFQETHGRLPTANEDYDWGTGRALTQDRVRELRRKHRPEDAKKGGAPKMS